VSGCRCTSVKESRLVRDASVTEHRQFVDDVRADDLDAEIQRTERHLTQLHQRRRERDDAAFLLTVARVVPAGVVFSAAELIAHARLDRALGHAIGTRTAKQLGHYLRLLARQPAAGVMLHRCDERNNRGCIWSIGFAP